MLNLTVVWLILDLQMLKQICLTVLSPDHNHVQVFIVISILMIKFYDLSSHVLIGKTLKFMIFVSCE